MFNFDNTHTKCYLGLKTKFPGVIIYQSSTWNDHISIAKQKVSKSIGIIKRVRKGGHETLKPETETEMLASPTETRRLNFEMRRL